MVLKKKLFPRSSDHLSFSEKKNYLNSCRLYVFLRKTDLKEGSMINRYTIREYSLHPENYHRIPCRHIMLFCYWTGWLICGYPVCSGNKLFGDIPD